MAVPLLAKKVALLFASSQLCSDRLRARIYRRLGAAIAPSAVIYAGCIFTNPEKMHYIRIGENSFVNCGCFFENNAPIAIGSNVAIAPQCSFFTTTHPLSNGDHDKRVRGQPVLLPVTVGHGSWIGARSTLLPGSRVDDGAVIGACGLVLEEQVLGGDRLYVGAPTRALKNL